MPKRKIILLVVAMLIAVVTVMVARSMMNQPQPTGTVEAPPEPASQVLGAARDLPMGTIVKESDLKWIAWPVEAQSTNLYVKGKTDKPALVGAVLRQGIRADEPLISSQTVNPHAQGFLAAVLQPGMRAMSITVNPGGQVAGFIFPGDRVDVILSHTVNRKDVPALSDRHLSETVLTNVRVLALDQKSDDQTNDPKIAQLATLEVTPQQAEHLALSAQIGTLSLSLRSLTVSDTILAPPTPDKLPAAVIESTTGTHTWDSDISQAFPTPGGEDGLLQKVQVMRGKETSETTFERRK